MGVCYALPVFNGMSPKSSHVQEVKKMKVKISGTIIIPFGGGMINYGLRFPDRIFMSTTMI